MVPTRKRVPELQTSRVCAPVSVTREVTRFQFEIRHGYVPPDLTEVGSRGPLHESEPVCRVPNGGAVDERIEATFWGP